MTGPLRELLAHHPLAAPEGGKDSKGDLVIVGGAPSCPGAAILAGRAALRCGAGRVQLVVDASVTAAVGAALPEALVLGWAEGYPVPEAVGRRLGTAAAVVVGPGLDGGAPEMAIEASRHMDAGVLVVDARSLPALTSGDLASGPHRVAAPNPKEAAELLGEAEVDDADEATIARLAGRLSELVAGPAAVRGQVTVLYDGDGQSWQERSSAPGLGTPGSGDVLMGALGGFLARGASPLAALGWAVAVHSAAGARLGRDRPVGFLASEVADELPHALAALQGGQARGAGRAGRRPSTGPT